MSYYLVALVLYRLDLELIKEVSAVDAVQCSLMIIVAREPRMHSLCGY